MPLGAVVTADVEIMWPSGVRETLKGLHADQLITVKEGAGVVSQERFSQ